jgi:cysteinyl-tRNA synthetase
VLSLFNTCSGRLEKFKPLDDKNVKLYSCGLTVYDRAHIGHGRTAVVVDVLLRLLRTLYGNVTYVRNITDVDDKINARAREEGVSIGDLTGRIIPLCDEDLLYLNNLRPTHEPRVTDHLGDIVTLIEKILVNGHAYVANGHVFFDVNSYGNYGALSHVNRDELLEAVRIEDNPNKRNPLDFVLWKPSSDDDDESSKFPSPWGTGRPGWHIECSAMSHRYLGPSFDLHCGGADLKFPHHENEIAQSKCAFPDSDFARFWLHVGFLMVDGKKMSKSLGNFVTIEKLRQNGVPGSVLRLAMIKNHYRKPLNFSGGLILESETLLRALHRNLPGTEGGCSIPEEIIENLCDDLNTPKVIATLSKLNRDGETRKLRRAMEFLGIFDENLITGANRSSGAPDMAEIERLIEARNRARTEKNWSRSDDIRKKLESMGIALKDTKDGTLWEFFEK